MDRYNTPDYRLALAFSDLVVNLVLFRVLFFARRYVTRNDALRWASVPQSDENRKAVPTCNDSHCMLRLKRFISMMLTVARQAHWDMAVEW